MGQIEIFILVILGCFVIIDNKCNNDMNCITDQFSLLFHICIPFIAYFLMINYLIDPLREYKKGRCSGERCLTGSRTCGAGEHGNSGSSSYCGVCYAARRNYLNITHHIDKQTVGITACFVISCIISFYIMSAYTDM